jgi:RNA polymerase sigma factor (sigma-70 family)
MAATAVHVRSPGPARARRLPRVGDDRLVARVRAGDDAAFEIIYDRYYRGLLAFCGHMLGSRQEAEDALQHSFASAYRALRGSAGDIDLRPWLYTIARNRCLSALRAQRAQVSADGLAAEVGPFEGMSAQVQLRADLRELVDELQRLPDDQRAALVLFELGDESHAQIAAVLGVRREKVKALVFQAREALMRARDARATPCVEIREQLATEAGRVPRRSVARRHIDRCPGCADFEREVRRQRAAFAAILPLVPTVGLKASVLGVTLGGGGGGALAAGGVGGGGVAGSAGAAAAGAIGTAGAASVATGLATGSGAVGLASLPGKAVVAKILSVVALGGAGAQAQVHSHRPARPPAIHQPALRATEAVPAYPPSPHRHAPAAAPAAIQATRGDSPVTGPEASAAPPASSSSPAPAVSHAAAAPAPAAPSSSPPSASATPPATAATASPSEAPAATPAPATAAPSSAPAAGSSTTPSVTATTTTSPTPAPVPAPAPAPSPITPPPATAPTEGTGTGTAGTAAPAADTAAASASAAAVAAS